MPQRYRKSSTGVPDGYFAWEAAGLRWLAEAGGAHVVEVLGTGPTHLDLPHLQSGSAAVEDADALGRGLARTHAAGAAGFGTAPPDWEGEGWLGPLAEPLPLVVGHWATWGEFYAEARILPAARTGRDRGVFDTGEVAVLERLAHALGTGRHDTDDVPARLHGDLWSGNVMWTSEGAVLIDPAAHGGHRETDLAMLQLFGCPHLPRVLAAYDEAAPLADGWRERVLLHQVHPLLVHAILFGGAYIRQALDAAEAFG